MVAIRDPKDMFDPLDPELITIWEDGVARSIRRDQCHLTDRSRHITICDRRRYINYNMDGTGYTPSYWNEDTEFGSAIHDGFEALLGGQDLHTSVYEFEERFLRNRPETHHRLLQETWDILRDDMLHLGQAQVYLFHRYILGDFLERFEILEIEPEINWVMGVNPTTGLPIVVMSRPDVVVRDRNTQRLWHVSIKTIKEFDTEAMNKLEIEPQKWAESYAIMAKYGEIVDGSLYIYAQKGRKGDDEELGVERYTTGLIRPQISVHAQGREMLPTDLSFVQKWRYFDESAGKERWKSCTPQKDWYRGSYAELDYDQYLSWLTDGAISPYGEAHVNTVIMGPIEQAWEDDTARRWLLGAVTREIEWLARVERYDRIASTHPDAFDIHFRLDVEQVCYAFRQQCSCYDVCWHNKDIPSLVHIGKLKPREPNHPQEKGVITSTDEYHKS